MIHTHLVGAHCTGSEGPRSWLHSTQAHIRALFLRTCILYQIFIFLCIVERMAEINKTRDKGRSCPENPSKCAHIGNLQVVPAMQCFHCYTYSQAHDPQATHILPCQFHAAMFLPRPQMANSLLQTHRATLLPSSSLLPTPHPI